jgi:drug/metabolite transporter (DMT)-like permease
MPDDPNKNKKSILPVILLHVLFFVYSFSTVLSKLAAGQKPLSLRFCLFYGGVLFLLALYALVWQQLIKKLPLVFAYANKAITIVWGIIWGALLFSEEVTPGKIIGAFIVIVGIVIFSFGEKEVADE